MTCGDLEGDIRVRGIVEGLGRFVNSRNVVSAHPQNPLRLGGPFKLIRVTQHHAAAQYCLPPKTLVVQVKDGCGSTANIRAGKQRLKISCDHAKSIPFARNVLS